MKTFFLSIDVSAAFVAQTPTLQVLVDGEVVSASQITNQTGNSAVTLSFILSSQNNSISSLQFLFNDTSSEAGRSIVIERISINNYEIDTSVFILGAGADVNDGVVTLNKNETLDINVNAIDYVFGQADAQLSDLDTVTQQGTAADEKLVGGKQSAVIDGGDGRDEIRAGQEDDQVYGGAGNDRIYGNDGDDFILGGAGTDNIYGRRDNDLIYGNDGDDGVNGGEGNDVLVGGNGNDRLYGESGNDILDGGADDDLIYMQDGDDSAHGGTGNDRIYTGAGTDVAHGGDGDDRMFAEGGANTLNGDAGNDILLADNDNQTDTLNGGEGNDRLVGNSAADILNGDEGDDRIEGHGGDDIINGGAGRDVVFGMNGNDTIYGGDGLVDDLRGGAGNDEIHGEGGVDKILGEDGDDILHGGDDRDTIRGGNDNDIINGDAGNDKLFGDAGNDTINGGDDDDLIRGGTGNDTIDGGNGNDIIVYDDNNDIFDGGAGYDIIHFSNSFAGDVNVTAGELNAVNVERIALNNYAGTALANTLTISIADISSISSADTLYITGDIGQDSVNVSNLDVVGDFVQTINVSNVTYDHYQQGAYNLYIENGLTVFGGSAPIAQDDNFAGTEEVAINGNLLADNGNGVDVDPSASPITAVAGTITSANGATVTIAANGDFTYTPPVDFFGTDTFIYSIQNGAAQMDSGLVTITLVNDNDAPIAQDDSFTATRNIDLTGDLLADNGNGVDTDPEGEALGAVAETITSANGATVVINADGTFTYTPATGFVGPDTFDYTLIDAGGATSIGSVDVTVQSANSLPAGNIVLDHDSGASTSIPDTTGVNTGGPWSEKTTIVKFETGADITTRQTIYEQGGGTRGINVYIEGGQLHMAVWNFAEENWGYQEVTTAINANSTHLASLVFDGALPNTGTIAGYLDGSSIGQTGGVGLLYAHGDDIGVGQVDGSTVYGGTSSSATNTFQGTVEHVIQYNNVLTETEINQVEANLGTSSPVFIIEDVTQDTVPNDPAINDGGPYAEKTHSVAFTTGADVTTRQVIYEQGGTVRGLMMYIEGGELHIAAWNFAEENWGYKEVTTTVNANEFYTSTLLLEGIQNETGTLTGYLNGFEVGVANNVGFLYNHPGAVGVGELVNGAVFADGADGGDHIYVFGGTIERIIQYNDALGGSELLELHSAQAGQNPNVTDNTSIGTSGDDVIGGGNGNDNIQGREGNDQLSGNAGSDTIRGEDGNDILYGNSDDDFLYGGDGDDILVGGTGLDVMYGDGGSDTFGFLQIDGQIDQIRDFTLGGANADIINVTDILDGFDLGTDDITDFVIVNVVNSARTDIRINHDGAGNDSQVLAIVRGSDFTGNDAQDLLNNGTLIVDQSIL